MPPKIKPVESRAQSLTVTLTYDLIRRVDSACPARGDRSRLFRRALIEYLDRQSA